MSEPKVMLRGNRHDEWVALGFCSYINWAKTWCNGKAGHGESHWALRLLPSGNTERVTI
jgi:hypothetical protein